MAKKIFIRCVIILLLLQAFLLAYLGWVMSPNQTEVGHMGASVYFWNHFRFDVFHVNPPLTRIISGIPVMLCDPVYDGSSYSPHPQDRCEWELGKDFLKANTSEKIRWCFAFARWIWIPVILAGGLIGFFLARDLYGESSALIFLVLWVFSPLILSWGGTICPDTVAASIGIIGIYTFRQSLYAPKLFGILCSGLFLGLMVLSKLTWIIAFGIWPLIWGICILPDFSNRDRKKGPIKLSFSQLLAILLIGLYTLNLGYVFEGTFQSLEQYEFISVLFNGREMIDEPQIPDFGNRFSGTLLGKIPVPLPAEFVQGIDTQRFDFEQGKQSYLRGEWKDHGWWYYYIYALMVKMPLGTWILTLLCILITCFRANYNAKWRDELLILLPFLILFIFVSSQTGFSLHSRYIIPALPFLFIWISKVGCAFKLKHYITSTAATLSLGWMIISSLAVFPHSLTYFNELSGGPQARPNHLLGSNLDWGQELYFLEEWYLEHPEARPISVAYWGSFPLEKTKIISSGYPQVNLGDNADFPSQLSEKEISALTGWYVLSVNEIYSPSSQYKYFLNFEPEVIIGNTIYVYKLDIQKIKTIKGKKKSFR